MNATAILLQQPVATIEEAVLDYAGHAHHEIATNGKTHIGSPFTSVDEFVDFEFNGDALDEARRLAREFGVHRDHAEQAMRDALADADLGHLNAAFAKEVIELFIEEHAEAQAERILDRDYDDEDFEPQGYEIDRDDFEEEFRSGPGSYGYEPTRLIRAECERLLNERLAELTDDRDRDVVQDYLNDILAQEADQPNEHMNAFDRLRNRGISFSLTAEL